MTLSDEIVQEATDAYDRVARTDPSLSYATRIGIVAALSAVLPKILFKVKKLKWNADHGCTSEPIDLNYAMSEGSDGTYSIYRPFHGEFKTQEIAQSAAQTDFERNIKTIVQLELSPQNDELVLYDKIYDYEDGSDRMMRSKTGKYVRYDQSAALVGSKDAEIESLRQDRRMIVSHATMGNTDGVDLSVNDISCRITAMRNELYEAGKVHSAAEIAEEQSTLRFCEREWSKERGTMLDTILKEREHTELAIMERNKARKYCSAAAHDFESSFDRLIVAGENSGLDILKNLASLAKENKETSQFLKMVAAGREDGTIYEDELTKVVKQRNELRSERDALKAELEAIIRPVKWKAHEEFIERASFARKALDHICGDTTGIKFTVGKHVARNHEHLRVVYNEARQKFPRFADTLAWLLWHDINDADRLVFLSEHLPSIDNDPTAKQALQVIADLPPGKNDDITSGHEDAYRAVEALFASPPDIVCNIAVASQTETIKRLQDALIIAEAALSDIGDAEREEGDDLEWCEKRAAKAIPQVRSALSTIPRKEKL